MAISFPASPSNGDIYTYNGAKYVYDGVKWVSGGQNNYIVQGEDATLGSVQMASLNEGPLAGMRNQLINGDFRIWQRGTTVSPANDVYTADRWYSSNINASSSVSRSGVTAEGFDYVCNLNADCNFLFQAVELQPRGGNISPGPYVVGSTWTLSVYSTLDLTSTNSNLLWRNDPTGSSVSSPLDSVNGSSNWSLSLGSVADANGFSRYEKTFVVDTAPPAGTLMMVVNLGVVAGGAVVGAQLEPGPVATPFEHRPIGTELALCQRYLMAYPATSSGSPGSFLHSVINASGSTGTETTWQASLGVTAPWMRISAPTVSFAGDTTGLTVRARSGGSAVAISSIVAADIHKGVFTLTVGTATDPSTKTQVRGNQASGFMLLDAEL